MKEYLFELQKDGNSKREIALHQSSYDRVKEQPPQNLIQKPSNSINTFNQVKRLLWYLFCQKLQSQNQK